MNNIDYKAVVEILENFLKKEKTEILGISVGEEYQLRQAIENLIQENKELNEVNQQQRHQLNSAFSNGFIHKDKIKEKIEYYKKIDNSVGIMILEKLLED